MLWHYTQILFAVAGLATILSFHKNIDRIGQVFFLLTGATSWFSFGVSLLKINFKWGGATTVVSYTYIPSDESFFVYLFMGMGVVMLIIGLVRAWEIVFGPVMTYTASLTGQKLKPHDQF
jgi:hypothetical protein